MKFPTGVFHSKRCRQHCTNNRGEYGQSDRRDQHKNGMRMPGTKNLTWHF